MKYKKKTLLFIAILTLNSFIIFGQDKIVTKHYEIHYGTNPNIETGSQTFLDITSLAFDQTNLLIKNKVKNKTANLFARIGNFGLVQFYLGSRLYGTIPHEYFGHYSRAKEFGINPTEFNINFPGLGGDIVFIVPQSKPAIERQMIASAGPEVTGTIAYKATQNLYTDDYSSTHIGFNLFVGKFIDQFLYYQNNITPFLKDPNKYYTNEAQYFNGNPVPNDPIAYVLALTESYGYYDNFLDKTKPWVQQFPDMGIYTQNEFIKDQSTRMKSAYLQTALDPTNLYFVYANAMYLIKGKTFFKPFMFKIKGVSFMPSIRANLGENGIENYYDMFFKVKNLPAFSLYYRTGGNMFHQTKGLGTEFRNLKITDRVKINGQLDYWNNERTKTNNFNIATGINLTDKKNLFSVSGNVGYKSYGNLMGKPFGEGIYGYVGLGINLKYKTN